jgi:hypothetical protein
MGEVVVMEGRTIAETVAGIGPIDIRCVKPIYGLIVDESRIYHRDARFVMAAYRAFRRRPVWVKRRMSDGSMTWERWD